MMELDASHRLKFSGTCFAVCQRTSCFVDARGCSAALLAQRPLICCRDRRTTWVAFVSHN